MRILITGTSRGIGLEFVRQYAARGEEVFAAARRPGPELQTFGAKVTAVELDVADENSIRSAREAVGAKTGALDLLINNAGIYAAAGGRQSERFGQLTVEDGLRVFRTNSLGPLLMAQAFQDLLRRGHDPKLVNITSGYGSVSDNHGQFPYHYSASKAALNQYMRSLAADLPAIHVAVLSPGWVRTDMGGPGASLEPEQSVQGMIQVIDKLRQSSVFLDWRGREQPW